MGKYDELMEKIEVTEEMRSRILKHLKNEGNEKKAKIRGQRIYKKLAPFVACVLILLAGAWGLTQRPADKLALPGIVEVASAKELSQKVGFEIKEIASLKELSNKILYTCFGGKIAEISYNLDGKRISFRKSVGTDENSGDYHVYETEEIIAVNGCQVTTKGYNELWNLATWRAGEYSYSIGCREGMTGQEIQKYILAFN